MYSKLQFPHISQELLYSFLFNSVIFYHILFCWARWQSQYSLAVSQVYKDEDRPSVVTEKTPRGLSLSLSLSASPCIPSPSSVDEVSAPGDKTAVISHVLCHFVSLTVPLIQCFLTCWAWGDVSAISQPDLSCVDWIRQSRKIIKNRKALQNCLLPNWWKWDAATSMS